VIERWLRQASRARAATRLREETVGYYEALSAEEWQEDETIAAASARASRRVRYD